MIEGIKSTWDVICLLVETMVNNVLNPVIVYDMTTQIPGTVVGIDRILGSLGLLFPIVSMGLFGAIRPLPKNADWMDKDIKLKGGLIAGLYSFGFIAMFAVTLFSGRVWVLSYTHDFWVIWVCIEAGIYILGGIFKWLIMKWEVEENVGNHAIKRTIRDCESPFESHPWYVHHRGWVLAVRKASMWAAFGLNIFLCWYCAKYFGL